MKEIQELKSVKKAIHELKAKETDLSRPKLKDFSLIKKMYDVFCQIQQKRNISISGTYQRGKFLYLVMLFYSPGTLAGGNTLRGLNNALLELFKIKDRTFISNNISESIFYYENYVDFKEDVDFLYSEIVKVFSE